MVKLPDEALLNDVRRVAAIVGGIPSAQDYRKYGEYNISTLYRRFGSWTEAREAAGINGKIEREPPLKIDRDLLLKDIWGLYRWLGRVPTIQDYQKWGRYSQKPFYNQFDGWVDARREAGVFDRSLVDVTKQDLIERLQWLYEKLGREPKIQDYKDHITENTEPFYRYGGFEAVKKDAGVWEGGYGNESRRWSKEEVKADIREKNELVDGIITVEEYKVLGDISDMTAWNLFGSFTTAREAAGVYQGSLLERRGADHPRFKDHSKRIYRTDSWYQNKPKALKRDSHQCVYCGMGQEEHVEKYDRALHVHHIIPAHFGVRDDEVLDESVNALSNLITLCEGHHRPMWEGMYLGPWEIIERYCPT